MFTFRGKFCFVLCMKLTHIMCKRHRIQKNVIFLSPNNKKGKNPKMSVNNLKNKINNYEYNQCNAD